MKFAIFKKEDKDLSGVEKTLLKQCELQQLQYDSANPDIVFVLGGDGTFLKATHAYLDKLDSVKFAGIRCGTLGFFYDFDVEDIPELVESIKANRYLLESHQLLECQLNNKVIYAVNEIRFENPFHTLVCEVEINGEHLEKFHGNGLLVCSELGSTAYNKSLGGAVISHEVGVLQLTEISTIQNNLYRSLGSSFILPTTTEFAFNGDFNNVVIGYDHLTCDCNNAKTIRIKNSNKMINIIYSNEHSSLSAIKRSFIK